MVLLLLFSVAIVAASDVVYNLRNGQQYFEDFIQDNHKVYKTDEEKALRYDIFMKNLDEINDLNRRNKLATFSINQFTDLTRDEFVKQYTGCKFDCNSVNYTSAPQKSREDAKPVEIPSEFDWRTRNVVGRVKQQGGCGSCWAFSALGNVESVYAIKTGQVLDLSVQQLVDCDSGSNGCQGGFPEAALSYLRTEGAMSETSYPYESRDNKCRYDKSKVVVNISTYLSVPLNEDVIAEQLYQRGPLSIALDSSNMQSYSGGILTGEGCRYSCINHAVLLVGYGVENGVPYWLGKNSWDQGWGERGYFKMQRGVNCLNVLGMAPLTAVI